MDIRAIKSRIKGVQETRQITKAMKLISAAKLKKARSMLDRVRPFFRRVEEVLVAVLETTKSFPHPYFNLRGEEGSRKSAYLVLAGDRTLAGSYNSQLFKFAEARMSKDLSTHVYVAGQTGRLHFISRGYKVVQEFERPVQNPTLIRAREVTERLVKDFLSGEVDEVYLIYTRLITTLHVEPTCVRLLPLQREKLLSDLHMENGPAQKAVPLNFEPSPEAVFESLVPHFLKGIVFDAFVESFTSEQSARMTAMDSATANADELLDKLNLAYNRARQAAITQEISEIVGGASALHEGA
jgi:F-type H+-transporting ATPase subunit gamma